MTRWARPVAALALSSAAYGFSIGIANSWVYGLRNLVKFPLLIGVTAATCALCYHVASKFLGAPLSFLRVQRVVLGVFHDISVLLVSLTPVVLYLAATMQDPVAGDLGGYPGFLRFNVVAIALTEHRGGLGARHWPANTGARRQSKSRDHGPAWRGHYR